MILSLLFLISHAFPQLGPSRSLQVDAGEHPAFTIKSPLKFELASAESAFQTLLRVGAANHIPMAIVLDSEATICRLPLKLPEQGRTVAEFIDLVHEEFPGYRVGLEGGVLSISPEPLRPGAATFLGMKLADLHSDSEPMNLAGIDLWMFIHTIIAPGEGTAFIGSTSTKLERIPAVNAAHQDVRTILNTIVNQSSGGVWILHSSKITNALTKLNFPYDVYGYAGEEQFVQTSVSCSTEESAAPQ